MVQLLTVDTDSVVIADKGLITSGAVATGVVAITVVVIGTVRTGTVAIGVMTGAITFDRGAILIDEMGIVACGAVGVNTFETIASVTFLSARTPVVFPLAMTVSGNTTGAGGE